MTNAKPTSGREEALLLPLAAAGPGFLATMAGIHAATRWDVRPVAFVGVAVLAIGGVLLLLRGLFTLRPLPAAAGLVVLVSLLACGLVLAPKVYWQGRRAAGVTVTVMDAQTGRPIANATVRLGRTEASEGQTDSAGEVRLTHKFKTDGNHTAFHSSGGMVLWTETLEVHAEGYYPLRASLDEYLGSGWGLDGPPLPPVSVALTAK
jgi:hypothetical protein